MFDLAKNESHPNTCTAMLLIKYTIYAQRKHPATQAGRNIHYTAILNKKPARVAGERRRIAPTNRKPSSPALGRRLAAPKHPLLSTNRSRTHLWHHRTRPGPTPLPGLTRRAPAGDPTKSRWPTSHRPKTPPRTNGQKSSYLYPAFSAR